MPLGVASLVIPSVEDRHSSHIVQEFSGLIYHHILTTLTCVETVTKKGVKVNFNNLNN
jgi:hypothetical protein